VAAKQVVCLRIADGCIVGDCTLGGSEPFLTSGFGCLQSRRASTLFSCYTILVSFKPQLRNVTVTLEEDVAQWARIEAARRDTSVSRLLGELLKERMSAENNYEQAMRRSLRRKPFLKSPGLYLTRE
jgi:hypothetical protein